MGDKKKKNFLEKLKIDEVSMVGQGANQNAFVSLLKTAEVSDVAKQMFSDVMQQMEISDEFREILNRSWKMGDALYDSFYSILMNPEITEKKSRMVESFNQYILAMMSTITNADVIKEIQTLTKTVNKENGVMSKELEDRVAKMETEAANTAAILKTQMALASMNDVQKAYYTKLSDTEKTTFIEKSTVEMDTIIAKIAEGEEKYTTSDGNTISKSDVGAATFDVLKSQDERLAKQADTIKKHEEKAIAKSFEERAEKEFPNLAGTPEIKGNILKTISSMPDTEKEAMLTLLKASNDTAGNLFKEIGSQGTETLEAGEKLEKMAKDKATSDGISYAVAYGKVLATEEGSALYEKTVN